MQVKKLKDLQKNGMKIKNSWRKRKRNFEKVLMKIKQKKKKQSIYQHWKKKDSKNLISFHSG